MIRCRLKGRILMGALEDQGPVRTALFLIFFAILHLIDGVGELLIIHWMNLIVDGRKNLVL